MTRHIETEMETFVIDHQLDAAGGGGKDGGDARTPVEAPNTLHSKAVARAIDMLGEGELEGLVDGAKSIYFDGTQLQSDDGEYNFGGVTYVLKKGTPDQTPANGFSKIESETSVSVQVTKAGGGIVRTIADTNVDDVRLTLRIPAMQHIDNETGDINRTSIQLRIRVRPDGLGWVPVKTITKQGKCTAPYTFSVRIEDLPQYGDGPWDIEVERLTADSTSAYLINDLYWFSYTAIINDNLAYPDTAYVALELDAQYFNQQIPQRGYEIYGMKIQVPDNYTPATATYSGIWDGTFKTEYSNNPAWVYYDLLTNDRYGLGLDADNVDKWSLYEAAQYCDVEIDDGFGGTERRFTFNYRIENAQEAYHVLNYVASSFNAMPFWSTGLATVSQDRDIDTTRLAVNANVLNGDFEYSSTGLSARHTIAFVTWFDPEQFYQPVLEVVDDYEGIERYGVNIKRITAYGCTSRGQAYRTGKWLLYTELHQKESVKFQAGWEFADCLPGEIIKIQDRYKAGESLGGRVESATTNTITVDRPITIENLKEYYIDTLTSSGTIQTNQLDMFVPGDYTELDIFDTFGEIPETFSAWMIKVTDLVPKEFRTISVEETQPGVYDVTAIEYDSNKFDIVEQGLEFDPAPFQRIPTGELDPPTDIEAEEYTYADGQNPQFGVLLSWDHSPDPRNYQYQVQARNNALSQPYIEWGFTGDNYFDIRPVTSGVWDFRTRATGLNQKSEWLEYTGLTVYADPAAPSDVTGLQVVGGGSTFSGRDIEIEWDTVSGTVYRFKRYKVEVYDTGDQLLRAYFPNNESYVYTYDMSQEDNGTAERSIKFKVYCEDVYGKLSQNAATLTASNPAPNMAGLTPSVTEIFKGLKVDWSAITPTDNDLDKFKVYIDTDNPPTTEVAEVGAETRYWVEPNLTVDVDYKVQIEPYDAFGVGTKSSVSTGNEPLALAAEDVDIELVGTIVMSDSIGTTNSGLQVLYDRDTTTSGMAYTCSGTNTWIQYEYGITDYIDRVVVWMNDGGGANGQAYFSVSTDGSGTRWFGGTAGHQLDANGRLTEWTNETAADTNYYQLGLGKNVLPLPQRVVGNTCRIYFANSSGSEVIINELQFYREVVAEQVIAENLAAINADLGVISAGSLQSQNLTASGGMYIGLNDDTIYVGGTANPKWSWDGANSTFNLDSESIFNIEEGGTFFAGDGNIMIQTGNDSYTDTRMFFGEDGAITSSGTIADGKDYMAISEGDITSYRWFNGEHRDFKTLSKVETGIIANDTYVNVGYFPRTPKVLLSPANLQTYNAAYSLQDQSFRMEVQDLTQETDGSWKFKGYAQLTLTSGAGTNTVNESETNTVDCDTYMTTSTYTTPDNCSELTLNITYTTYHGTGTTNEYYYRWFKWRPVIDSVAQAWKYEYPLGSIGQKTASYNITGLSNTTHSVYIQACADDDTGTFYSGSQVYEYQWVYNTTTYDDETYIESIGNGDQWTTSATYNAPTLPAVPSGWTDASSRRWQMRYRIYGWLDSDGNGASNDIWVQGDLKSYFSYLDSRGFTQDEQIYSEWENNNDTYGTDAWQAYTTKTINAYSTANISFKVDAEAGYGSSSEAKTGIDVDYIRSGRYVKREVPVSEVTYNAFTWNNYNYTLGDYFVLASGTMNYLAIDGGE